MDPGLLLLDRVEQFYASEMRLAGRRLVEDSEGRPVRDEHVEVIWDQIPVPLRGCAARIHESPIKKLRGVRRAPKRDVVHRHTGVLQVDRIRKKRSSLLRSRFEVPVVISAADHPMLEGLVSKPSIERQDLLYVVPGVHKVA